MVVAEKVDWSGDEGLKFSPSTATRVEADWVDMRGNNVRAVVVFHVMPEVQRILETQLTRIPYIVGDGGVRERAFFRQ